jgi:hypothetical protein
MTIKTVRALVLTFSIAVALVAIARPVLAEDLMCRNEKTGEIKSRETCKAGQQLADVREADDAMVAGCTYLGDVTASSGWGGLAQGLGQSRSRNSALKRAAQKGATHIVWSRLASGWGGGNASARTYKCEPKGKTS